MGLTKPYRLKRRRERMNRKNLYRLAVALLMIGAVVSVVVSGNAAQPAEGPGDGERPEQVDLFGDSPYTGGYLKYSYRVSREGVEGYSITTTEIIPQEDGMYQIDNSSTDVVPLDAVNIGFFGIPLRGLGFRIPTSSGGTVDLSPLSAIEEETLEPNSEIVLPDGGYLVVGDAGTVGGLEVVFATYTHADFTNVQINLAMPVDLTIRNLLPLFPLLELEYQSTDLPEEGAEEGYQAMRSFSRIELIEFVYEP
jgi:hypothetical protein